MNLNLSVGTLTALFLLVLILLAAAFSGSLTRRFGINFGDPYGRNGYLGHLQKRLLRAGFFIRSEELIAFSLSLALLLAVSALLLEFGLFPALLLGLGGYLSPFFILEYRRARKLRKFEKQLPPALSIIANGLRSGYSFAQALEVVHQDTLPPLSDEFGRVIRDNRLGRPFRYYCQFTGSPATDGRQYGCIGRKNGTDPARPDRPSGRNQIADSSTAFFGRFNLFAALYTGGVSADQQSSVSSAPGRRTPWSHPAWLCGIRPVYRADYT